MESTLVGLEVLPDKPHKKRLNLYSPRCEPGDSTAGLGNHLPVHPSHPSLFLFQVLFLLSFGMYNLECTIRNVLFGMDYLECTIWNVLFGMYYLECTIWNGLFGMYYLECTIWNVLFGMYYLECTIWNVLFGMYYLECTIWNVLFGMYYFSPVSRGAGGITALTCL